MPDVNMQPLRDLLASHPEECAAVVALLVSEGSTEGTGPWSCESLAIEADVPIFLTRSIVMVLCAVGVVQERGDGCTAPVKTDRRAIARMGAAAWLREKCRMGSRAPRYEHEAAIVARVAHVLGCSPGNVRLGWRSGALDSIGVCRDNGPDLCGDDIAALLGAGFSVSLLGWDVPADCVGEAVKDGEQR